MSDLRRVGFASSRARAWFRVDDRLIRRMEFEVSFPIEGQSMTIQSEMVYAFNAPASIPLVA